MRLDSSLIPRLLTDTSEVFGGDAELWLFGSRVDDNARGGDIDLYVETADEVSLLERRLEFQRRLFRLFGDRKVDVVIHPRTHPLSPIHRIARKTGILLNEVQPHELRASAINRFLDGAVKLNALYEFVKKYLLLHFPDVGSASC